MMRNLFICLLSTCGVALVGCEHSFCEGDDCGHDHGPVTPVHALAHDHPTEGPHQGSLVELGNEEFHAEIVHDEVADTVSAYILDSSARLAVPISATQLAVNLSHDGHAEQFRLSANPQASDPPGRSSMFTSTDAELGHELDLESVKAQLVVKIAGKQYRGAIVHRHDHGHAHQHEHDDALVWQRSDIQHAHYAISLGHHSTIVHAGEPVEPAVSITNHGTPVSDAQVYISLWSGDGKTLLAKEVRTIYEPPTDAEPAHYAQGELNIPSISRTVVVRFRVVYPGSAGEVSYDMHLLTDKVSSVAAGGLPDRN
jgi:hypothetical protein